jgi:ATP-dependent Clp protease ATP-binding subunit ClpA
VDLSCCIIVMTSNLGAGEMEGLIRGGMGFARKPQEIDQRFDDKITRTAQDAARRKFSPEFMNRIDKVVVFKTLRPDHLEQILEIELGMVQQRVLQATGNNQFVFSCTPAVKQYLLAEGTDPKYGARHLKRSIERNIVFPLANLVATGQVKLGDFVRIDMSNEGRMVFVKEAEGALVPVLLEKYGTEAGPPPQPARARTAANNRRDIGATPLLDHK